MNYSKDPRIAKKLAREQAHLRKIARRDPESLKGKERAICDWDMELDNYVEPVKVVKRYAEDEDEYADFG